MPPSGERLAIQLRQGDYYPRTKKTLAPVPAKWFRFSSGTDPEPVANARPFSNRAPARVLVFQGFRQAGTSKIVLGGAVEARATSHIVVHSQLATVLTHNLGVQWFLSRQLDSKLEIPGTQHHYPQVFITVTRPLISRTTASIRIAPRNHVALDTTLNVRRLFGQTYPAVISVGARSQHQVATELSVGAWVQHQGSGRFQTFEILLETVHVFE